MTERDVLTGLASAVDSPVTPDPAFGRELRARLLAELGEDDRSGRPMPISRPTRIPTTLQAVATVLIVIGLTVSIIALRDDNSSPRPVTTSITNGVASTDTTLEQATIWEWIPEGDMRTANGSGMLTQQNVAVADGLVLRAVSTTSFEGIIAVSAETGETRWQYEIPHFKHASLTAGDGGLFVYAATGELGRSLIRLDFATGEEVWNTGMYSFFVSMAWIDDGLVLWDGSSKLELYDGETGVQAGVRYFRRNSSEPLASPLIAQMGEQNLIVHQGVVLASSFSGFIIALPEHDVMRSAPLWQYERNASFGSVSASGEVVAVGFNENYTSSTSQFRLLGLDLQTGAERWVSDRQGVVRYPIAVPGGFVTSLMSLGVIDATPTIDQISLEFFDAETGIVEWSQPGRLPANVTDDGAIILGIEISPGFESTRVVAISATNGELIGSLGVSPVMGSDGIPVDDDRFYIITLDNRLLAIRLDALTGD